MAPRLLLFLMQGEEAMKKAKSESSVSQTARPSAVEAILAIAAEMARRLGENISKVQLQPADAALNRESSVSKAR